MNTILPVILFLFDNQLSGMIREAIMFVGFLCIFGEFIYIDLTLRETK